MPRAPTHSRVWYYFVDFVGAGRQSNGYECFWLDARMHLGADGRETPRKFMDVDFEI